MTVGYKSMAGYTVDFRQLGCNPTAKPAMVKYGGGNYNEYLTGNGTVSQDYNAAANVELTVDLPEEAFDAYYVKPVSYTHLIRITIIQGETITAVPRAI